MTCVLPSEMPASSSSCGVFCPKSDIAARKETLSRPKTIGNNFTPHPPLDFWETVQRTDRCASSYQSREPSFAQQLGQRYARRRYNPRHPQNLLILDVGDR